MANHIISANTLADLKAMKGKNQNPILLLGKNSIGDGMAAHYYFDDDSTEAEDSIYLNIVQPTGVTVGRWKKVIARILTIMKNGKVYSYLVYNGGKKELYIPSTTIDDGTSTVYLTMDGTPTGAPVFSEIWFDDSKATINTANVNDAVSSCRKSLSTDLKTLTHNFFRGNSTSVNLLGLVSLNLLPFRSAAAGTTVQFKIEGI